MKTTDADKMTQRINNFDACLAELSPEAQRELEALAVWISKTMLSKGGGVGSAKELIYQVVKFQYNNPQLTGATQ